MDLRNYDELMDQVEGFQAEAYLPRWNRRVTKFESEEVGGEKFGHLLV